jgi:hypothetical protein
VRARGEAAIPYEGHLLRVVRRQRLVAAQARQLAELCREEDRPLPVRAAASGGDRARLRGVPVAGFGGAIRGSRPTDCIGRSDREGRALWVLGRDIEGTSPGTEPLAALLEAEAETLRLVAGKAPAVDA